jgi:hypothetical protein
LQLQPGVTPGALRTYSVGVAGYKVYRAGTQIATVTGTSYQDSGLDASTAYSYTVAAYDAAGNTSAQSASASATTQAVTSTPTQPVVTGLSSAQITSILAILTSFGVDSATLAKVQAVLSGTSTSTGGSSTSGTYVFTRDLKLGSTGADVLALQQYLNAHGFTIATSGSGSPGNETTYFGPSTQAALIKYQIAHGITPANGYFGTKTRAAVNAGQ